MTIFFSCHPEVTNLRFDYNISLAPEEFSNSVWRSSYQRSRYPAAIFVDELKLKQFIFGQLGRMRRVHPPAIIFVMKHLKHRRFKLVQLGIDELPI